MHAQTDSTTAMDSQMPERLAELRLNDDRCADAHGDADASSSPIPRSLSDEDDIADEEVITFPPAKRSHILNCSFHSWYPRYRSLTPKTRLIPLSKPFLNYLRADGIVLPDDDGPRWAKGSGSDNDGDDDDDDDDAVEAKNKKVETGGDEEDDEETDITAGWEDVHEKIRETIKELGGMVHPKLNWSAPKDATWISSTHTMECHTPADVYLLLKSSDFVTHDLEHVWDDTVDDLSGRGSEKTTTALGEGARLPFASATSTSQPALTTDENGVPYHLVLRKSVKAFNPSLEFRCFVRGRKLVGITQRDRNYYPFLFKLRPQLSASIRAFFEKELKESFPDEDYAFDVYVPMPYDRVWLMDINPWAARTDSLLFDWAELISGIGLAGDADADANGEEDDDSEDGSVDDDGDCEMVDLRGPDERADGRNSATTDGPSVSRRTVPATAAIDSYDPFFRLIRKSDPESYNFSTAQYSAHKLPKEVVDAASGRAGEVGITEFAAEWFREVARREERRKNGGGDDSESDDDDE